MFLAKARVSFLATFFMAVSSIALASEDKILIDNSSNTISERIPSGVHEILDVEVSTNVKKYINSYLKGGKKGTARILGNASVYFPVFDEYLIKHDLPLELKYLSVVESRLNPNAESHVGAVGLWQLMPATARELGLDINDYVDERKDVYKSTDAALKYLKKAYKRFGDWNLAIAAYNCGSGRVSRLLRASEDKTFAGIRAKLPKETRHYLERFIAASYVMKNYQFHNLRPVYPDYTLQYTKVYTIKKRYSLNTVEALTGVDKSTLKQLNPALKKGIIPPSYEGYHLILPSVAIDDNWMN